MKIPFTFCGRFVVNFIGLLAALAIATVTRGQSQENAEANIPLIHFDSIPLNMGIENLARQADLNYILGPLIPDTPVTKQWKNVSARSALTNLLAEHKLFLVESPATTVTLISITNRIVVPVDAKWIAADTNQPVPLIQFAMAPMQVVFAELGRKAGTVLDVAPRLDAMVSVRWKNLKPRQAIAALCENYNLVLSTNAPNGGIRIAPK